MAPEAGVADWVDPLAGSYAVNSLTTESETRAAALIAEIDRRGGMMTAIEAGFPQGEIERRAYEHQRDVEERRRIIVGGNQFVDGGEEAGMGPLHRPGPALARGQVARARRIRDRPGPAVARSGLGAPATPAP